jgi:DNA-binding MarR family transcriptional regulator
MNASVPSPESRPTDTALADVVARLRRAMRRAARAADPDGALSVAQLELLSCLAENPGARPSQLARLLNLAPNSVTNLVNTLQGRGLIVRSTSNGDRRAVSLRLTDSGSRAVEHWHRLNTAILRSAFADLNPAWQHLLDAALPALRQLIEAIDVQAEHGQRPDGTASSAAS